MIILRALFKKAAFVKAAFVKETLRGKSAKEQAVLERSARKKLSARKPAHGGDRIALYQTGAALVEVAFKETGVLDAVSVLGQDVFESLLPARGRVGAIQNQIILVFAAPGTARTGVPVLEVTAGGGEGVEIFEVPDGHCGNQSDGFFAGGQFLALVSVLDELLDGFEFSLIVHAGDGDDKSVVHIGNRFHAQLGFHGIEAEFHLGLFHQIPKQFLCFRGVVVECLQVDVSVFQIVEGQKHAELIVIDAFDSHCILSFPPSYALAFHPAGPEPLAFSPDEFTFLIYRFPFFPVVLKKDGRECAL